MMTTKTHNYECCMCGDHGLSYELFRCKVCHFRSQHRYCSNLYPKAESYRVCNWCLIQKNNNDHQQDTLTPTTTTTSNSPSSQDHHHLSKTPNKKFNNHVCGPRTGIGAKSLQPTSPIKKPAGAETRSPSGRKRIVNGRGGTGQNDEKIRRTKSEEISNNNNNNNSSSSSRSSGGNGGGGGDGGGGPAVIKHVFRNKVRRYKLLEEVSS